MKFALPLLIFGLFVAGCKDKELSPKHLSNISVVRETDENQNVSKESSNTVVTNNVAATPPRSQSFSTPRYHIIVASFGYSEKARAERLIEQLKSKNYPATILNSSQRFRISIESFPTESEAKIARDEYRTATDREDIWIHKIE